ncbi:glutathione S-transferase N-terminal domain-containing protein [Acidithiobacillus montserratensis]|uniref:Glutathione S-transferase N-terminal domain-containing protein n=1 Tax=Acidithiobacillus montserratensis TaxID=2729135 RepID=A0ACD5HEM9_9PROT|nr:glutathione S-transferase N-terminal domain-containing protein [Acidithiobacillus montserratensis]MBN2679382.1 glutathione S-transferase N-terminal domain-containing protein [Acidithiobacillaceae bacterium]MBU2747580.1 stringent starvation protein A [Acidithiobacillus montserratensis]
MATPSSKKTLMTLYSSEDCVYAHRVRFVLEEKAMEYQTIEVDLAQKPEELAELNAYNQVPTLLDRDLAIHESVLIMEYLDERFPHPPLIPVDPISRAKVRMGLLRFDQDWFAPLFQSGYSPEQNKAAKEQVRSTMAGLSAIFTQQRFLFGDELSILDCAIAPLLWRFPVLGISLPAAAKATQEYMDRLFQMESFKRSLTPAEKAMR